MKSGRSEYRNGFRALLIGMIARPARIYESEGILTSAKVLFLLDYCVIVTMQRTTNLPVGKTP